MKTGKAAVSEDSATPEAIGLSPCEMYQGGGWLTR